MKKAQHSRQAQPNRPAKKRQGFPHRMSISQDQIRVFSHSITIFSLYFSYFNASYPLLTSKQTSTTSLSNLLLGQLTKELGLDNHRDINLPVSKQLEISFRDQINNGSLALGSTLGSLVHSLTGDIEQLVNIARGGEIPILQLVELTHTDFTEVPGMVFVKQSAVVVLSSGVTATSRVFAVFADAAVAHLDVAALLSGFVETGGHDERLDYDGCG
jgi:hypothetical protein